jgi:hypothetical protein
MAACWVVNQQQPRMKMTFLLRDGGARIISTNMQLE